MSGLPQALYKYEIRKINFGFELFRLYLYENNDCESRLDTSRQKIGIIATSLIDSMVKELKTPGFSRLKFESYLKRAVFFELFDEHDNGSIWVLLPDNTPVLWFLQEEKAYKYTYREMGIRDDYIKYACRKFDKEGRLVKK